MPFKIRHLYKLIAALRSGLYTKIKGKMRNSDGYDVLGVACDSYRVSSGKGKWIKVPNSNDGEMIFNKPKIGLETLLCDEVVDWFGFDDPCPSVMFKNKQTLLIDLNDFHNLSFNKIADVLEKNL